MKRFSERLAALEALEAQQAPPVDAADLLTWAVEYIQDGALVIHDRRFHLGPAGYWPGYDVAPLRLCEQLNDTGLLADTILVPLYAEQMSECRAGFASGDWFFGQLIASDPAFWLGQYLRTPSGEIWNTQAGGALARYSYALAAWAAQRDEVPTVETVVQWIEGLE